jgi:hypothetical protein
MPLDRYLLDHRPMALCKNTKDGVGLPTEPFRQPNLVENLRIF